jgi:flagellar biosynthesis protein
MSANGTKKAAAMRFRTGTDHAPLVVAKGRGKLAEKIIAVAQANQVPLVEDPGLVQVLEALDVNTEIPSELYHAVAEVLVFVYRMNQAKK